MATRVQIGSINVLHDAIGKRSYAEVASDIGIDRTSLFNYAAGRRIPSPDVAERIARTLQLHPMAWQTLYDVWSEPSRREVKAWDRFKAKAPQPVQRTDEEFYEEN